MVNDFENKYYAKLTFASKKLGQSAVVIQYHIGMVEVATAQNGFC